MRNIILLTIIIFTIRDSKGQSDNFISTLKTNTSNEIIVFDMCCTGCIVVKEPCEKYINDGNPCDKYVIWKSNNSYYIRRFNVCGSSNILRLKKWADNPFDLIREKNIELDTTKMCYPLSLNSEDSTYSTWFETRINHYKYYNFSFVFPNLKVKDIELKDYAFFELSPYNEAEIDLEYRKNFPRYKFNNESSAKRLLTIIEKKIDEVSKKLDIKTD